MANAAIMARLNHGPARYWWVWGKLATRYHMDLLIAEGLGSERARAPYDGTDMFIRIVGSDPDAFAMFQAMDREHRARYMQRLRAMPLPPTAHPMEISDPVTGEFACQTQTEN